MMGHTVQLCLKVFRIIHLPRFATHLDGHKLLSLLYANCSAAKVDKTMAFHSYIHV